MFSGAFVGVNIKMDEIHPTSRRHSYYVEDLENS